jgi:hypothetical protein
MSFISITFDSIAVSAYQDHEVNTKITAKEVQLRSGEIFGAVSKITSDFPLTFDCYINSITEYDALKAKIGYFKTLVVGAATYTNCYISLLGSRKEIIRGSGKYTYKISFSRVDQY